MIKRQLQQKTLTVYDYIRANPGTVAVSLIAEQTGIAPNTVANSCRVIMARDRKLRRVPGRGLYEYRGTPAAAAEPAAPAPRPDARQLAAGGLVEMIGRDADCVWVGRDEGGGLYRLMPL